MIPRLPGEPPRDLSRPLEEFRVAFPRELAGQRLDFALAQLMPWRSRTAFHRLIADGFVLVDGKPARAALRVREGEVAVLRIPPARRKLDAPPTEAGDLPVVFEDAWCVAIDKPSMIPVHPAGRHLAGTVIHWLHKRYRRADEPDADVVPRLMHRLDRETSGLLLASKDPDFHYQVGRQFEDRKVEKVYLAVVEGRVASDGGIVDFGIGPATGSSIRIKLEARRDGSGLHAVTNYRVLRRSRRFSLLEVTPRTGRQHQIRIHLAAIGHAIVGDKVYGPDEQFFLDALGGGLSDAARARLVLPRQALHSHALTFQHPRTGERVTVTAPLAPDLTRLLDEDAGADGGAWRSDQLREGSGSQE